MERPRHGEGQLGNAVGGHARRVHRDALADRRVVQREVVAGARDDDALLAGLHAHRAVVLRVDVGVGQRGQHHQQRAGAQHRVGADGGALALLGRPRVGQRRSRPGGNHLAGEGDGRRHPRVLAAEGEGEGRAHPGAPAPLHGLRVRHRHGGGQVGSQGEQRVQDDGAVARAAGRHAIALVAQDQRPPRGAGGGARQAGVQARVAADQPVALPPQVLRQAADQRLGLRRPSVAVGQDHLPEARHVEELLRVEDGGVVHPPLRHRRGGASVQGLERLLVGAVVAEGQHRQVRPGQHRVERAVQHGERGPEGAAARRALVAVRVGEVGGEQVAVLQDLRRDVGVEVERGGDRHGRPDRPAQVADQRAFRVVEGGRQHAAVQRQDHRVEAAPARGLEHEAVHLVEHGVLHRAAGLGAEQRRHDHFHAGLRRRVHDAAERRIGAAGARHGVLAGADDEALAPGQDRVEAVGFLRDAAGQDAPHRHGHLTSGPGAVSPRGGRLCRSGARVLAVPSDRELGGSWVGFALPHAGGPQRQPWRGW